MQLLYVYIGGYIDVNYGPYAGEVTDEPFRVLKNVEFNFSNKFRFHLDEFNVLDVEEIEGHIPEFFDKDGVIKSISAIIGKNGSGKSSIIDLIKSIQPDNFHRIPYKLIVIYGNINNDDKQVFSIFRSDGIIFHLSKNFSTKIIVNNITKGNLYSTYGVGNDSFEVLKDFQQIFYSPVFELQFSNIPAEFETYGDSNFTDISSSHLIERDAEESINSDATILIAKEVLTRHMIMDVERQFHLVNEIEDFNSLLEFKKPQFLEIIIDSSDFRFVRDELITKDFNDALPVFSENKKTLYRDRFIKQIIEYSFFNLVRNIPLNYSNEKKINELRHIVASINKSNSTLEIKEWLTNFISNININPSYLASKYISHLEFAFKFFQLNDINKRFLQGNDIRCRLDLKNEFDKRLISDYFKMKSLTGFLQISWKFNYYDNGQLSSGERAKFNLFSRFHAVLKKANQQGKNLDNILVIIDEGDTLLHPEWQRTYFNDLLKGLKLIFRNTTSIQIILTTHSPFVTSDLPWYSIIKLNKDEETGLTRVNYNNSKPTFAANIHDLFHDSFYMEEGFVGEFARTKINDLFKRISKISKADDTDVLKKEISLIGEPFVKNSLYQHLDSKLNSI